MNHLNPRLSLTFIHLVTNCLWAGDIDMSFALDLCRAFSCAERFRLLFSSSATTHTRPWGLCVFKNPTYVDRRSNRLFFRPTGLPLFFDAICAAKRAAILSQNRNAAHENVDRKGLVREGLFYRLQSIVRVIDKLPRTDSNVNNIILWYVILSKKNQAIN